MNALTVVFAALCIFAIGYRFYGLFIANKVLNLNDARVTPAVKYSDGHDYVDTNKYVLFGHHFAAIAAAGPLLGPVLAAQFGYMPGLLWILIGCVLAGGVHDMVVLFASVRHRGQSLAYIASQEIDKTTGSVAAWAVLAILLLTLAGLSIAVVNAMHNKPVVHLHRGRDHPDRHHHGPVHADLAQGRCARRLHHRRGPACPVHPDRTLCRRPS